MWIDKFVVTYFQNETALCAEEKLLSAIYDLKLPSDVSVEYEIHTLVDPYPTHMYKGNVNPYIQIIR